MFVAVVQRLHQYHAGRDIARDRVEELIALVDGSMVNAFIELKPDPRGVAARMLRSALSRQP